MINLFKRFWSNRLCRFLVIGLVNTIFGYGVFALLIFFKLNYSIALLGSVVLGAFFNFLTIGRIVFRNTNNRLILRFLGVYALYYVINLILLSMVNSFLKNNYISQAILVLPMAGVSYLLNRKFVFDRDTEKPLL